MITFTKEYAIRAQASTDKPRIFDQHTVKTNDFLKPEVGLTCLEDCAPPALQPIARRAFTFDLKTCATVGKQYEAGSARKNVAAGLSNSFRGSLREPECREFFQCRCSA